MAGLTVARELRCTGCTSAEVEQITARVAELTGVAVVDIDRRPEAVIVLLANGTRVYMLSGQSADEDVRGTD